MFTVLKLSFFSTRIEDTAFTLAMGECVQTYLNSQASKGRRLDGKWV